MFVLSVIDTFSILKFIGTWIHENQLIIGLIFSAIVGTMPESLPTISQLPQWTWTWFRSSSKTFLNFRKGEPDPIVINKLPQITTTTTILNEKVDH